MDRATKQTRRRLVAVAASGFRPLRDGYDLVRIISGRGFNKERCVPLWHRLLASKSVRRWLLVNSIRATAIGGCACWCAEAVRRPTTSACIGYIVKPG